MSELKLQIAFKALDKATAPMKKIVGASKSLEQRFSQGRKELKKLQQLSQKANQFAELVSGAKTAKLQLSKLNEKITDHKAKQAAVKETYQQSKKAFDAVSFRVNKQKNSVAELTIELQKQKSATTQNKSAIKALTQVLGRERAALAKSRLELSEKKSALSAIDKTYKKHQQTGKKLYAQEKNLNQSYHASERRLRFLKKEMNDAGQSTKNMALLQFQLKQKADKATASLNKQAQGLDKLAKRQKLNQIRNARSQKLNEMAGNTAMVGFATSHAGRSILGGLRGGVSAVSGLVDTAREFESFQTVLKTTEGTQEKAQKAMDWVSDFAVKTPYELAEVTDAFVKLRAYGLDPTSGLMETLGDTASAMGKPMIEAVEAIADAVTGENERLKNFGIKAGTKGNTITYSYTDSKGIQKEIKADKRDRKMIEEKLKQIWNEKYKGASKDQAKTLTGLLSNLSDQWARFQVMIMKSGAFDALKKKIATALTTINKMASNGELQAWADDVAEVLVDLADNAWEMAKSFAKGAKKFINWARENKALVKNGIKFVAVLGAIMSVLGPLIITIGALVGALALFNKALILLPIVSVIAKMVKLAASIVRIGLKALWASAKGLAKLTVGIVRMGGAAMLAAGKGLVALIATIGRLGITMLRVGLAMLTNPIFLAIAAIAAGAYLIYKNWDGISAFFKNLWNDVTEWFTDTWELLGTDTTAGLAKIGAAILDWSPIGLIYKAFAAVIDYFDIEMPDSLTGFLSETGTKIKDAIMSWTPVQWIADIFSGAFSWVSEKLDAMAQRFGLISNKVTGLSNPGNIGKGAAAMAGNVVGAVGMGKGIYKMSQSLNDGGLKKAGDWLGIDKLITKFDGLKTTADSIKNEPFTIKQDANKTMSYNGQFAINVQTDGSVMSNEVSRLVQLHAGRYFAQQEAKNRNALFDSAN